MRRGAGPPPRRAVFGGLLDRRLSPLAELGLATVSCFALIVVARPLVRGLGRAYGGSKPKLIVVQAAAPAPAPVVPAGKPPASAFPTLAEFLSGAPKPTAVPPEPAAYSLPAALFRCDVMGLVAGPKGKLVSKANRKRLKDPAFQTELYTERQCKSVEAAAVGKRWPDFAASSLEKFGSLETQANRADVFGCPDPLHKRGSGAPEEKKRKTPGAQCYGMTRGRLYSRAPPFTGVPLAAMLPGSHASNLLALPNGDVLLTYFWGREGDAGVKIAVSKLGVGESRWTEPQVVSAIEGRSNQNPVLVFEEATQEVTVLHTSQGGGKGQGDARVMRVVAKPPYEVWSQPEDVEMPRGHGPFVRNPVVKTKHGAWLLPMYYTPDGFGSFKTHHCQMHISRDRGKTFQLAGLMSDIGAFLAQQSVVRIPGTAWLVAFYRDRRGTTIYRNYSWDDGMSWTAPRATALPNNNSGIQVCALKSGALAIVFNNAVGQMKPRFPLTIALSYDDGLTWPYLRDLELGGEDDTVPWGSKLRDGKQVYSYPAVTQTADGLIHVAYTWRRTFIKHVAITEEWIRAGGPSAGLFQGDPAGTLPAAGADDRKHASAKEFMGGVAYADSGELLRPGAEGPATG